MAVLEEFVAFANGLPADRSAEIDEVLESIMRSESAEFEFTPEELAELDRRAADPNPEYADPAEIEANFSRFRSA